MVNTKDVCYRIKAYVEAYICIIYTEMSTYRKEITDEYIFTVVMFLKWAKK